MTDGSHGYQRPGGSTCLQTVKRVHIVTKGSEGLTPYGLITTVNTRIHDAVQPVYSRIGLDLRNT